MGLGEMGQNLSDHSRATDWVEGPRNMCSVDTWSVSWPVLGYIRISWCLHVVCGVLRRVCWWL